MTEAAIVNIAIQCILLTFIVGYLDRYEKEPVLRVLTLFIMAIAATVVFGAVKASLLGEVSIPALWKFFGEAAFLEEALKFGLLLFAIKRWKCINEPFDALVYLSVIALGFSFVENYNYILATVLKVNSLIAGNVVAEGQYGQIVGKTMAARALPGHLMFDMCGGWVLARAFARSGNWWPGFLKGFLVAVLCHGFWNLLSEHQVYFSWLVFGLTAGAVVAIADTLRLSNFRKAQERILRTLYANQYLAESLDKEEFGEGRKETVSEITRIKEICERKLPLLKGREQKEFVSFFDETFPEPVSDYVYEGEEGLRERLTQIEMALQEYGNRRIDWSFLVGLFLLLMMSGLIAFAVTSLVLHVLGKMIAG